jgi:hypothetical protein
MISGDWAMNQKKYKNIVNLFFLLN